MAKLDVMEEIKDLRSVWPDEAADFTPWLAEEENLDILARALGLSSLQLIETEPTVGNFSAGLYAIEKKKTPVIIESELEQTSNECLGKLITYAAGKQAGYLIWLVKEAKEEHRAAVEWLNSHTNKNIGVFLCEIKLYKIGDSKPAVQLSIIEKPNGWTKRAKKSAGPANSESMNFYQNYWIHYLDYAFENPRYSSLVREKHAWKKVVHMAHPKIPEVKVVMAIARKRIKQIGLIICLQRSSNLWRSMIENRMDIEREMGFSMDWTEEGNLDGKPVSTIRFEIPGDPANEEDWPRQFEWLMVNTLKICSIMDRFSKS